MSNSHNGRNFGMHDRCSGKKTYNRHKISRVSDRFHTNLRTNSTQDHIQSSF